MPKRVSFPSMFPPGCSAVTLLIGAMQKRVTTRLRPVRNADPGDEKETSSPSTRPSRAAANPSFFQACTSSADGIAKIRSSWMKLASGVGFSNGWALFVLKNPPPFVPNILIASCEATGPCAIVCSVTVCVVVLPSAPVVVTCCGSTSEAVS